jgi:hypothetical protein
MMSDAGYMGNVARGFTPVPAPILVTSPLPFLPFLLFLLFLQEIISKRQRPSAEILAFLPMPRKKTAKGTTDSSCARHCRLKNGKGEARSIEHPVRGQELMVKYHMTRNLSRR